MLTSLGTHGPAADRGRPPEGENELARITEDQITRLVTFVHARIPDEQTLTRDEARRAAALRLVTDRQIAALRHYRHSVPDARARAEVHATASWNLLVSLAHLWHDHPDFPAEAAVETFEFDATDPLRPA
ncbi:hypothetical protein OG552_31165 [Streptomyces sp. NBC_01476]|uniref:hypothetical protein n=1 Tax=Streptomyces sp. NBC_01476 TaxID=2903881 RepID=UPI002E35A2EA|nr:hypothetical protein [Streptomyces sp. NBC_01476]